MTEQQELLRKMGAARDAALAASKAKTAFLGNMSHELRTPLNAIIGFSDVVQQKMFGPASPKYDEYLRDINASALHLQEEQGRAPRRDRVFQNVELMVQDE